MSIQVDRIVGQDGRDHKSDRFRTIEFSDTTGTAVELAPLECDLLLALLGRRGAAVSRYELLTEVWGHAGRVQTRTVDTHIAQLRRKLEADPSRPEHIVTVRKFGYRLRPDDG